MPIIFFQKTLYFPALRPGHSLLQALEVPPLDFKADPQLELGNAVVDHKAQEEGDEEQDEHDLYE